MTGRPVWLETWHVRFVGITYTIFAVDWALTTFGYPSFGMLIRAKTTNPEYRGLRGVLDDFFNEKLGNNENPSANTTNTDQKTNK